MQKVLFLLATLCLAVASCTKDKTDYEAEIGVTVPDSDEFKEAVAIRNDGYAIRIETVGGTFHKGYNEIRVWIAQGPAEAQPTAATFLPIRTDASGGHSSCPHRYELVYKPNEGYFSGYAVFTDESGAGTSWDLYLSFAVGRQTHAAAQRVEVEAQPNPNLNMVSFTGNDGEQYVLALVSPRQPKVGENDLVAGIYRFDKPTLPPSGEFPDPAQFSYAEASNYTLLLDPRMPEPSMGNHSSPNNKDLVQQDDGLYHGVVNYTMTGNWTLNFIMLGPDGQILRGTEVPADFTPGVPGVKGELHIDILF